MSRRKLWGCLSVTVIIAFDQFTELTIEKINDVARLSNCNCYIETKKAPVNLRDIETEWIHYISAPFLMPDRFYDHMFRVVRDYNTKHVGVIRINAPGINLLFKTHDMIAFMNRHHKYITSRSDVPVSTLVS